jgi:cell division protein FtsQ
VQGKPADEAKRLSRGTVRGLKVLVWFIVLSVVSVGLGLILYFTPLMSARSIVVTGTGAVTREDRRHRRLRRARRCCRSTPTRWPTGSPASAGSPAPACSANTSTLRITIVERVPLVVKDFPDGPHLFDRDGVDFATAPPPPGLAYIDVDNPGPSDPPTRAALEVMTALRPRSPGR